MSNKIIRSICYFTKNPDGKLVEELERIKFLFIEKGFEVQTLRICVNGFKFKDIEEKISDKEMLLSAGSTSYQESSEQLEDFFEISNLSFNLDLTDMTIDEKYVDLLFNIIRNKPEQTFNFAYVFNNAPSSPYFPSANYNQDGFSIGLQPTDLSADCVSLDEWFARMSEVWKEITSLVKDEKDFLGIDSSVAPLFEVESSLINFVQRLGMSFNESILTDSYLRITKFIKEKNPKPIGLCGLMLPCLEDFELANEYEQGNFSVERNLFLSLHSGLGIDTYPIGIDESPVKAINILKTVQGLSNKYKKPLSIRFVSDGKATIGEKTDFKNQYLKDVVVRCLSL
ncbi:MAG: DUF711 family protein [Patescibacteria group bacterium]|nr:DUF711 family protein [Patescibacteria group bacterium]